MRKYLIATHGKMASGLSTTIKLLMGSRNDIEYLDAYTEFDSISKQVKTFFIENKDNEIIVFTDLLAGSVNREIMNYMTANVHIISGFNLPLLLELLLSDEEVTENSIEDKIVMARNQMVYVNTLMKGDNKK